MAKKDADEPKQDDEQANLNLYSYMAHFVGEKLKIRPNEILDGWTVPELIVAYGYYVNEIAQKNFSIWESTKQGEMPKKYYVRFYNGE